MENKINLTKILSIWLIWLVIMLPMVAALEVSNIRLERQEHNSTLLGFETDEDATVVVNFFEKDDPVVQTVRNDTLTMDHHVFMRPLVPNIFYQYEFIVTSASGSVKKDNNGDFFEFKTPVEPDLLAPLISDIKVVLPTDNSARIEFITDEQARSSLFFGTTEDLSDVVERRDLVVEHTFLLNVINRTRYFFKIQACDEQDNCINSSLERFTAGMDMTPPQIIVDIPRFHNSNKLDVTGTTEDQSRVDLIINNVLSRSDEVGLTGGFNFLNVILRNGNNSMIVKSTDISGNSANKSFNITVDKVRPRLILSDFPEVASQHEVLVNGSVSKLATVTIQVSSTEDLQAPPQVSGLQSDDIGTNSIGLQWDQTPVTDFLEYGIFRDGVRITTTTDVEFVDVALDSGTSYTYQVNAVDQSCNEGSLSEGLDVATDEGGQVIGKEVVQANLSCSEHKFEKSFTVNGAFSESVPLTEGINIIEVIARDQSGNVMSASGTTLFDENPPDFVDTNLERVSPSYLRDVTLTGTMSEPAKIIVTVNGKNGSQFITNTEEDNTFSVDIELNRLFNKKQDHFEDRPDESHTGAARTGLILQTEDTFPNEIVILAIDRGGLETRLTGSIEFTKCGSGSMYHIAVTQPRPSILNPRLLLDGLGQFGMSVNLTFQGGTGNATIRKNPKIHFQPLSPEIKSRYNLDFIQDPVATWSKDRHQGFISVGLNPMDLSEGQDLTTFEKEELIYEFNLNNCTIPEVGCIRFPLQIEVDFELAFPENYFTDQFDRSLEDERVERMTQKQCWDVEVFIDRRVDPSLLPKGFLEAMVDMLSQIILFIDQILTPLQTLQEIVFYSCFASIGLQFFINVNQDWSCGFGRNLRELFGGTFQVEVAQTGLCDKVYPDDDQKLSACKSCETAISKARNFETFRNWVCDRLFCPSAETFQKHVRDARAEGANYIPDYLLFTDIGSSSTSFEGTAAAGIAIDVSSDCSKEITPIWDGSGDMDIKELWNKYGKNRPFLGFKFPLFSSPNPSDPEDPDSVDCGKLHPSNPECCVDEYRRRWDSACLIMDEFKESACLAAQDANKLHEISGVGLKCNRLWNSVAGFCEPKGKPAADIVNTGIDYDVKKAFQGFYNVEGSDKAWEVVSDEGDFLYLEDETGYLKAFPKASTNLKPVAKARVPPGAAKPAATPGGISPGIAYAAVLEPFSLVGQATGVTVIAPGEVGSYRASQRNKLYGSTSGGDFGCLRGHRIRDGDEKGIYYRILPPDDGDEQYYIHRGVIVRNANIAVSDSFLVSKLSGGAVPGSRVSDPHGDSPINAQLVFRPLSQNLAQFFDETSRSDALKAEAGDPSPDVAEFEFKRAHPDFYSDLANCVSAKDQRGFQRFAGRSSGTAVAESPIDRIYNEIREKIGISDKPYIVDPTSGLLRTVQCACLPGFISYLKLYKNMADAIRNCFNTILVTGDGSPGVCQAVISVYVCDMIFDLIKCFTQRYSVGFKRSGTMGIGNVFGAITSAGTKTFSSINSRYGSTNLFRALFVDRKIIHAICLFAFTGIWNLDVSGLLDAEAGIPIKSQGFLYPCERRYTSFDPSTEPPGLVTWTYHMGAGLVAGAELNYRLELICSDEPICNTLDGFARGICDCQRDGEKKLTIRSGRLTKGEILDEEGDIFETVPSSPKRFDRAKLVWEYINNNGETVKDEVECKVDEKGGKPPVNCDFQNGNYRCGVDFGGEETIRFNGDPDPIFLSNNDAFRLNDKLRFDYDVDMELPDHAKTKSSTDNEYTKFLGLRLFNQNSRTIYDSRDTTDFNTRFEPLFADGRITGEFTAKRIDSSLFGANGGGVRVESHTGGIKISTDRTNDASNTEGRGKSNTYYFIIKENAGGDLEYYITKDSSASTLNDPAAASAASTTGGTTLAHKLTSTEFTPSFRLEYTDPVDGTFIKINRFFEFTPLKDQVLKIIYLNPADGSTELCGGQERVTFTAEFTIYDAANNHGAFEPSTTIARDRQGDPQRRRIRFPVMCSASGFTPIEENKLRCMPTGEPKKRCFCGSDEDFRQFLAIPSLIPKCGTDINGKGYCVDGNICSEVPECGEDGGKALVEADLCACNMASFRNTNGEQGRCPELPSTAGGVAAGAAGLSTLTNVYCHALANQERDCHPEPDVVSVPKIRTIEFVEEVAGAAPITRNLKVDSSNGKIEGTINSILKMANLEGTLFVPLKKLHNPLLLMLRVDILEIKCGITPVDDNTEWPYTCDLSGVEIVAPSSPEKTISMRLTDKFGHEFNVAQSEKIIFS